MHGQEFLRLEGEFVIREKPVKIVMKLPTGGRKTVERNEVGYEKLADHIGSFPLVMIAPRDNVLILDSSRERRKLIDRVLAQTDAKYLDSLMRYNKLLDQRNALLKSGGHGGNMRVVMATYNERMRVPAEYIYEVREQFVSELRPIFMHLYGEISGGNEKADLHYESRLEETGFLALCEQSFERDLILKRSGAGIHRDDVHFEIDGVSVKNYASQGQLKSLVIAFKLAQFVFLKNHTDTTPVILLDDVFDKLDSNRVRQLVHVLFDAKLGQVFITDTDRGRIENIFRESGFGYHLFEIKNGECTKSLSFE